MRFRSSYHGRKHITISMQPSYILDTTDGERSSVRSSEDASGSHTDRADPDRQIEQRRLLEKINGIKEQLLRVNLEREGDVEEFLSVSQQRQSQRGADNPQMSRIKQNFEKKNKKHTHDTEHLQKKLLVYEQRLSDLLSPDVNNRSHVMSSVGQNIRRTGANLRDAVIGAPLELMDRIKGSFGSADDVTQSAVSAEESRVGLSTFYAASEHGSASGRDANRNKSSTLPAGLKMDVTGSMVSGASNVRGPPGQANSVIAGTPLRRPAEVLPNTAPPEIVHNGSWENLANLSGAFGNDHLVAEQLSMLRQQLSSTQTTCEHIQKQHQRDMTDMNKMLEEERFKARHLEEQLNETVELHQVEFLQLKQDQASMGTRLEYQYQDKFRQLDEKIEAVHNQMIRLENSIKSTMDMRIRSVTWNSALLSGANILVEMLKIVLFVVATALDMVRPLAGSRNRAGFLIFGLLSFFVICSMFDVGELIRGVLSNKANETKT